jgi:hypothetical protein
MLTPVPAGGTGLIGVDTELVGSGKLLACASGRGLAGCHILIIFGV